MSLINREGQPPNRSTAFKPGTKAVISAILCNAILSALESLKSVLENLPPEQQLEIGQQIIDEITAAFDARFAELMANAVVDRNNRI